MRHLLQNFIFWNPYKLHGRAGFNEKPSYLFTRTLIGQIQLCIVRLSTSPLFQLKLSNWEANLSKMLIKFEYKFGVLNSVVKRPHPIWYCRTSKQIISDEGPSRGNQQILLAFLYSIIWLYCLLPTYIISCHIKFHRIKFHRSLCRTKFFTHIFSFI